MPTNHIFSRELNEYIYIYMCVCVCVCREKLVTRQSKLKNSKIEGKSVYQERVGRLVSDI